MIQVSDTTDEYCRIGDSTAVKSLKEFCQSVVACFAADYLRSPTADDLKRIERQVRDVGFPGCMGCLDCAGWEWDQCPKDFQRIMIGNEGVPCLWMKVICGLDLRIWHLYFGSPGVVNDLNILSVSPHFSDVFAGRFPGCTASYEIGQQAFDWLYYLADGICPDYKTFVKT